MFIVDKTLKSLSEINISPDRFVFLVDKAPINSAFKIYSDDFGVLGC